MERFEGEGEERGRGLKVWTPVKWRGGEARVENRDSTKLRKREYRITRGEIRRLGKGREGGMGGGGRNYLGYGHDLRVPRTGDSCLHRGIDGNKRDLVLECECFVVLLLCFQSTDFDFLTATLSFCRIFFPAFQLVAADDCRIFGRELSSKSRF